HPDTGGLREAGRREGGQEAPGGRSGLTTAAEGSAAHPLPGGLPSSGLIRKQKHPAHVSGALSSCSLLVATRTQVGCGSGSDASSTPCGLDRASRPGGARVLRAPHTDRHVIVGDVV